MADTFYAWSPILGAKKEVNMGDTVSKADLGVSDEDWDAMVEANVVRTTKPPKMEAFSGSVVEWYRSKARDAALEAGESAEQAALEGYHAVGEVG